jgi:hypothetical protein
MDQYLLLDLSRLYYLLRQQDHLDLYYLLRQ